MEAKASDGSTIRTGDMILVREYSEWPWYLSIFSHKVKAHYICINGMIVDQCIPLKGNEDLCGTLINPENLYIPEYGECDES